mgnify:CR=1 FL=1
MALAQAWDLIKVEGQPVGRTNASSVYSNSDVVTGSPGDPEESPEAIEQKAREDEQKHREKTRKLQEVLNDEEVMRLVGGLEGPARDWTARLTAARGRLPDKDLHREPHKKALKLIEGGSDGAEDILHFLNASTTEAMGPSAQGGPHGSTNFEDPNQSDEPLFD